MTIPRNLQIFEHEVRLTDKDHERLKRIISSWNTATSATLMTMTTPDLERLLVIELMREEPRKHMTDRLTSRLGVQRKHELRAKVEALTL